MWHGQGLVEQRIVDPPDALKEHCTQFQGAREFGPGLIDVARDQRIGVVASDQLLKEEEVCVA